MPSTTDSSSASTAMSSPSGTCMARLPVSCAGAGTVRSTLRWDPVRPTRSTAAKRRASSRPVVGVVSEDMGGSPSVWGGRLGYGGGVAQRVQGGGGEHVGDIPAEGVHLAHERGGDVGEAGIGEQEDGLDAGEVVVHARHRLLVGEVQLGAQTAHDGRGADLAAEVH